jgi:hypothetical protein
MSSEDAFQYDKLSLNTFVTIIIIFAIIFALPLILYIISRIYYIGKKNNDTLINDLQNKDIDRYNELSDIYLFCSYTPIQKLFLCKDKTTGREEQITHYEEIDKILEILQGKKLRIDADYTRIKTLSDGFINDNKVSRIKREFEEEQRLKKEAGENGRFYSNQFLRWIISIGSGIANFLSLFIKLALGLGGFVVSISAALGKNKVVTGFLIIVLIIIIVLSVSKSSSKPSSNSKDGKDNNGASSSNIGLSPTAIYNDLLDTYKYYSTMVKNVNVDFLGTSTETEVNVDDEDYDETLYRKIRGGKRYDNLSYIQLSSLDEAIKTEIKKIYNIEIDTDKYYNIYLPSEKFNILQSDIKWKTSNNANNEKIWDIDCKAIGKQGSTIDAFISNEGKCIINEAELKKADKHPNAPEAPTIYKTEYIK